jgi:hypothetical protein
MNLFSEFRELPFWSDRKRTSISIGPSLHPNVGLSDLQEPFAHTVPKKFVSGLGLKIEGDCPRGFREGLVYRLGHGYETIVGEQIGSPKGAAPVLTLSVPRGNTSGEVCMARLKYDGNDLYGVTATALAPHMGDAGDDVARVIGQFYRDVQAAHYGSGGGNDEGRKERKPPPFSHALIFSGARQLEYSDFKDGWGWVAGESALLIAGVTFTALSIAERNDQPSVDPDLDKARVYQGISYGAFGAIIPLRLFAGWAFSF